MLEIKHLAIERLGQTDNALATCRQRGDKLVACKRCPSQPKVCRGSGSPD